MKRVRRIGETGGPVTAGFGFMKMRMEYDLRALPGGPADRLRVAPTFMANRDTEYQRASFKNASPRARRIDALLGGVELDLVLEAGPRPVPIDDQGADQQGAIEDAFGAENDRDISFGRSRCNQRPGAFQEHRIRGRH